MFTFKQIYLNVKNWIENLNIIKKRKLYLKIISNYYLYSKFINIIVTDLSNKGIKESNISMILYYIGFSEPLVRIDIHVKDYGILTYLV